MPYTVREIATYIGVPHEEIVFECAGINHIAWMTRLEVGGEDAYPRLFEAMEDPGIYARDRVRFELMRRFGYFVTESSEHNAEYTPYFLRDDALIERFDVPVDEYVRRSERNLRRYADARKKLLAGGSFPLEHSVEYGSLIIHSMITGQSRTVYGNVENTALIGNLPPQLAATCAPHTAVQNLTVRAALEGKREHVYHAAMLDRHASSVLSLDELAALVDELIVAHGEALPEGLRASGEETR